MSKVINIGDSIVSANSGLFKEIFGDDEFDIEYKTIGDEKFFDATKIIKRYNSNLFNTPKRIPNFKSRLRTKELTVEISTIKKPFSTDGMGRYATTWMNNKLFKHFMIWLDVKYEIAVVEFIDKAEELMHDATEIRGLSKSRSLPMTDKLKELYAGCVSEGTSQPIAGFYATIQRKIHKKVTGHSLGMGGLNHDEMEKLNERNTSVLRHSVDDWVDYCLEHTESHREARTMLSEMINHCEIEERDGKVIVKAA
jgi:hypothetical protein